MNSYSHNFAVCIGRQLGSGGRNVALAISRKMGIAFYDKEIINQAAKDSGLDLWATTIFSRFRAGP